MNRRPRALVTGGARRVGAAICRELARAGCDVDLTWRTSEADSAALVRELAAIGATGKAHRLDLDDLAAVETFAARCDSGFDRLDVLVHNASVYEPSPASGDVAASALRHFRVNALAPLALTRGLAALLQRTADVAGASPCVVAMCDMHAMGRPRRGHAAYSMSKAALAELVQCLAREMAPRVRVNGVAPGVVQFPETGEEADEAMQRRYVERVPLRRAGTPEDAASAVRWLALEARYVTGEIVRVDGGRWLA